MGILGLVLGVALAGVVAAGGTGAYLYASDYQAEATVQDHCVGGEVPVKTKLFGLEHTVRGVPPPQCALLRPGNFVEHHVRSKHTTLYDVEGGRCIYDTVTGPGCGAAAGLL